MNKNTFLIILVACFALAAGLFVQNLSDTTAKSTNPMTLEFSLADLSGQQRNIAEWQGKILVINFWATWCPPCLKEIPDFIQLQNQFNDKNLQFIGIAIDDKDAVNEYLSTIKINYPMLIAGDEGISLSRQLGNVIGAVPFTLIVNQQGQIIYRHPGELSKEKIVEIIKPLITTSQNNDNKA